MNNILKELRGYGELHVGLSFDAVVRHPLADEPGWLEKLGIEKEDCFSSDVIWTFHNELVFISLFSTYITKGKSRVIYAFDEEALFGGESFTVDTEQFPLETKHVERMLGFLFGWLTDENNQMIKIKPSKSVQISNKDICV